MVGPGAAWSARTVKRSGTYRWIGFSLALGCATLGAPQEPGPGGRLIDPTNGRASAPVDLTGYWTSVINDDYDRRMIVPPKYDYRELQLTAAGYEIADNWDPERDARDGQACRAYGVAHIMRMPVRLHIYWEDDRTLVIETDHGEQRRQVRFDGPRWQLGDERTLQGDSVARWDRRTLSVITRNMRMGYLRRNGVPYSEDTVVTEYFDRYEAPHGEMFTVTTVVEDPVFSTGRWITTSDFLKLEDGADWNPSPCESAWGPDRELTMEELEQEALIGPDQAYINQERRRRQLQAAPQ